MQLVLSLTPGGTERLVIEIVRALESQVDSIVCCLDEPGEWAAELTARQVPVIALSRSPGFRPQLAWHLSKLMRQHAIDLVHCHHYSPYVYGALASLLTPGVRLIFTEHGKLFGAGRSRKRGLVNPWLARVPGRLWAVSGDLRRHMIAEGFPSDRVNVLYNGIDAGRVTTASDRAAARAALQLPEDGLVIGTAGRLDPVKNLGLLLEAHALVASDNVHARTVIVGDGSERQHLQSRAAELGVANSVVFAGYRRDVRALMAAFDIFVNCSTYEGVSLTILEAMASRLPVIATRVGGNPEVVEDGKTGVLVDATASALADAIEHLAHDPQRREVMGKAGRLRVESQFSMARMVSAYASAYLGLPTDVTIAPAPAPIAADAMSVSDATRSTV